MSKHTPVIKQAEELVDSALVVAKKVAQELAEANAVRTGYLTDVVEIVQQALIDWSFARAAIAKATGESK